MHEPLPGGEILEVGLRDLNAGVRSVSSLLLLAAAPRLARCGVPLPAGAARAGLPEHELYDLLVAEHGPEAYRHYRSLLRRLVSLENALDSLPQPQVASEDGDRAPPASAANSGCPQPDTGSSASGAPG